MSSQDKRQSILISNKSSPSTQLQKHIYDDDTNNSPSDNNKQPHPKRKSASIFNRTPTSYQPRKRSCIKGPGDQSRSKEKNANNSVQSQHEKKSSLPSNQSSDPAQSQTHFHLRDSDASSQDQENNDDNNVNDDISEHGSSGAEEKNSLFNKHQSLRQRAEQFCFGTLNLQLDCVDPIWNQIYGTNRPIKPSHASHLMKEFQSNGIHRMASQHHLFVACSAETWAQLQKHCENPNTRLSNPNDPTRSRSFFTSTHDRKESIGRLFSPTTSVSPAESPIIWGWKNNESCRLELLAGQHRIRALHQLLEKTIGNDESHIAAHYWWTCAIYNQGNVFNLRSFC
jgi:hypothetical protein